MLDKLVYTAAVIGALSSPGCAHLETKVQDPAAMTTPSKQLNFSYKYENGIEAVITYKKTTGLSDISIEVLEDPKNVLVEGIFVNDTPFNSSYQEMVDGDIVKKSINFRLTENSTVSVLFINSKLAYVKIHQKVKVGDEWEVQTTDYSVPGLATWAEEHLKRIEKRLELEDRRNELYCL